jgi:hypothetical protein
MFFLSSNVSVEPNIELFDLPRAAVSILKVIDQVPLTDIAVASVPHHIFPSQRRSRVVQPSAQSDFTENRD